MMHKIVLVLVCLACAGYGRRTKSFSEHLPSGQSAERRHPLNEVDADPSPSSHVEANQSEEQAAGKGAFPLRAVAALLLASHRPAAAFSPGPGVMHSTFGQQMPQRRYASQQMHRQIGDRMLRTSTWSTRPRIANSIRMAERDLYEVLGVSRSCSDKDLSRAYKSISRKNHPDINPSPDAAETMEQANKAYEILSDTEKRKRYDQFGMAGVEQGGGGGPGGDPGFGSFEGGFDDIFSQFFGGAGGQYSSFGGGGFGGFERASGPTQGDDLRYDLEIDFQTALFGGTKKIKIPRIVVCKTCDGKGNAPGSRIRTCGECGGRGAVLRAQRTILGTMQAEVVCERCGGEGQTFDKYCGSCGGQGQKEERETIEFKVPCGVEDGTRVRLRGYGNAGSRGGPSGDLYIYFSVTPDRRFRREGADIYSDISVSYVDAILGTTLKVQTVDGKVGVKVPPGTQPGGVLRLPNYGAPKYGREDQRGSHFLTVNVEIPRTLTPEQRELMEKLQKESKAGKGFGE